MAKNREFQIHCHNSEIRTLIIAKLGETVNMLEHRVIRKLARAVVGLWPEPEARA